MSIKNSKVPCGPSKMRANFAFYIDGKHHKINGFSGYKNWAYHPTKGFRKVSGFNPNQALKVDTKKIDDMLASNSISL